MNLAHSNDKPGALASTIKLDVRFVPLSSIKFEIKELHENLSWQPAGSDGPVANRGAGGKSGHLSGPGIKSDALC
jgi:hypothetical protein